MKKQHAIQVLNRIKAMQATKSKLRQLGVCLADYEDGVTLLKESVAILFAKDEKQFESILDDVQWWLYEKVDKVITLADGNKVDVTTPEAFVDWVEKFYGSSDESNCEADAGSNCKDVGGGNNQY